jgi:hypothetical protein
MKKLSVILAAAILVSMICVVNVQADTWLLGTSDETTLTYDGTNFSMDATIFNYSLGPDPHLWNPGYSGPYVYAGGNHKFQSGVNSFDLTINSLCNVTGYDRNGTDASITPVTGLYWAITLVTNKDSHIRGYSVEGLTVSGNHITGNLVSDGIFHWYGGYPDTSMASEDYFPKFYFDFTTNSSSGNLYTGTMQVYASNTPIPGTLLLLGSGLAGLAFYRRRRKSANQ